MVQDVGTAFDQRSIYTSTARYDALSVKQQKGYDNIWYKGIGETYPVPLALWKESFVHPALYVTSEEFKVLKAVWKNDASELINDDMDETLKSNIKKDVEKMHGYCAPKEGQIIYVLGEASTSTSGE